jgi:drug/metabolite transporter (DMT)-like permease
MPRTNLYPILQALLAATLFGASAPLAKLLLGEIEPIALAALLYWGSGGGILLFKLAQRNAVQEAQISRADWPWLLGAVGAGGIAAPIVLLISLKQTDAATASLLLNFEAVATTLIAALFFREAIGGWAWVAIGAMTLASILLSWQGVGGVSWGALGILAACALWGLDNNFTRNISAKDPLTIVIVKGLGAGSFSFCLSLLLGQAMPAFSNLVAAMILGSLSYGFSIVLFIHAMRQLGAARTSALFGTAPLVGVGLSFLLFQELPTITFLLALPLMLFGAYLLLYEDHGHHHRHQFEEHEHRHSHDDAHHNHPHPNGLIPTEPHAHFHEHLPTEHEHPHTPDIHHRHVH